MKNPRTSDLQQEKKGARWASPMYRTATAQRSRRPQNIHSIRSQDRMIGWFFSTVLCTTPAQILATPQDLANELRQSLSSLPHKQVSVAASVIDLRTDQPVYGYNADAPMVPASNMKIFVMAAALELLGPNFQFETVLGTDGRDLLVIGDGDPAFGDEKLHELHGERITSDFERWADSLLSRGITQVNGDLVIDESIFDDQWVHPSWEQADLDNWYAAPVGGLNFNDNCLDITVWPAKERNAPALVSVVPENTLTLIVNQCRSGGQGEPVLHHPFDSFEYRVSGRCRSRHRFESVSIRDPGLLFADSMRMVLAKRGVRVNGQIRRATVRGTNGGPSPSFKLIGRRVTSLPEVLARVGKDSQNLFAECLLKRTGYEFRRRQGAPHAQGSWPLGGEAIHAVLDHLGIESSGLIVADGSGLSRANRCTAEQLAATLARTVRRPGGELLYHNLSVAGVDGSLHKRLKDAPGRIHAKTGTMRGIRTLAGFVSGDDGPRYAFAVMFNNYPGSSAPYKERQDRICRALLQAAR